MKLTCKECGTTVLRNIDVDDDTQLADKSPSFTCAECATDTPRLYPYQFYKRFDRYSAMRESLCFDDGEIGGGYQVKTIRRPERRKPTPSWVMSDKQLSRLEIELHRERRGSIDPVKAIKALRLYFRARLSMAEIADELGITYNAAKCRIRRLVKRGNAFFSDPLQTPIGGHSHELSLQ